jgi:hypothetical protein
LCLSQSWDVLLLLLSFLLVLNSFLDFFGNFFLRIAVQ